MTSATSKDGRRRILRALEDEHSSRKDVLKAMRGVPGLERWMHAEAARAGLNRSNLDMAIALLGMRWATHAVKRYFLSPQEAQSPVSESETVMVSEELESLNGPPDREQVA